jgi:hypothetical protein
MSTAWWLSILTILNLGFDLQVSRLCQVVSCAAYRLHISAFNQTDIKCRFLQEVINAIRNFIEDKCEDLGVQMETFHLNGVCTMDLIKSLTDTVSKLCWEVSRLKNENIFLKAQPTNYQGTIFCGAATQRGSWPPHSWGFSRSHTTAHHSW